MPGNRPARKTPGGKGFSPSDSVLFESMLGERLAVVAAADDEVEVDLEADVAVVEVEVVDELDDSSSVSAKELRDTIKLQKASP